MSQIDTEFKKQIKKIIKKGHVYPNINRGKTRTQLPIWNFKHNYKDGFPVLSIKETHFKSVVGELLWFLRGDTSVKFLEDNKITIWRKDAYNWHRTQGGKLSFKDFIHAVIDGEDDGDTGKSYAYQWRTQNGKFDQIKYVIDLMKKDINSSRIKLNAWIGSELNECALPPCHDGFQIVKVADGFELHWNQRSTDTFLGAPFNIASYALLQHILAIITGEKPTKIRGTFHCVHLYENQINVSNELLNRDTDSPKCELEISKTAIGVLKAIGDGLVTFDVGIRNLVIDDFKLVGYEHKGKLSCEMLAPLSV